MCTYTGHLRQSNDIVENSSKVMKIFSFLIVILSLTFGTQLSARETPLQQPKKHCAVDGQGHLYIKGIIEKKTVQCVQSSDISDVTVMVLNSPGGDVSSALDIAKLLSGRDLHIIVEEDCSSSCANFLLPLATDLTVRPFSTILLHGSTWSDADTHRKNITKQIKKLKIDDEQKTAVIEKAMNDITSLVEREKAFIEEHKVRHQWLLAEINPKVYFSSKKNIKGVAVSETFLKSCLPNVTMVNFWDAFGEEAKANRRWIRKLKRRKIVSTNEVRCEAEVSAAT